MAARAAEVVACVEVPYSPEMVYGVWADVESYPKWMDHLVSVRKTGPRRSRWVMQRRNGDLLSWDTELTVLRPFEKVAWSSVDGDLLTYSVVRLHKIPGGTRITWRRFHGVDLEHDPDVLTGRFADPQAKLDHDIANLRLFLAGLVRENPLPPMFDQVPQMEPGPAAGPSPASVPLPLPQPGAVVSDAFAPGPNPG
jgi:hypothetical protein